jgi:hypothetical protein
MLRIAAMLPDAYRGIYRERLDERMRRMSVGAPE